MKKRLWPSAQGYVPIVEMTDLHLMNAVEYLRRRNMPRRHVRWPDAYLEASNLMTRDTAARYLAMLREARRRGLRPAFSQV